VGEAENKNLVRRIFEQGMNTQDGHVFDELLADDYVNHDMPAPAPGPEGFRQVMEMFWTGFPDARVELSDVVAEGDRVATRGVFTGTHQGEFMGIPASGASIRIDYMDFWRIEAGKARENWVRLDMAAMMQQLGAVPAQEG
jgi:steroid delta-isomerase-like uncharacterized protein